MAEKDDSIDEDYAKMGDLIQKMLYTVALLRQMNYGWIPETEAQNRLSSHKNLSLMMEQLGEMNRQAVQKISQSEK